MSDNNYADIREEYKKGSLEVSDTLADPIQQFQKWFKEAQDAEVMEVNAMCLSTVDKDGQPDARIVLVKDVSEKGFVFYTNYESHKGQELEANPYASLTFFWPELQRQVRIRGTVKKVSEETSAEYFHSRPRGSQIGAWTSPQSQEISGRGTLEIREKEFEERFNGKEIPKPDHWGGYLVKPESVEFWQGRPSRLHDRIFYSQQASGEWKRNRLAP